MPARLTRIGCAIVAVLVSAGCGSGDFASEVSARPTPIAVVRSEPTRIRLPVDQKFSIAMAPSRQAPGLGGSAKAVGLARPDGVADASAEVENGGESETTFQIGHAFRNDTDRQLDLDVNAVVECEYAAVVPTPAVGASVDVGLRLYARNSRNVLVRKHTLVAHNTDDGTATRSGRESLSFTLALGPGEELTVFVAGQALVKSEFGKSASCRIGLKRVEMEIVSRAAPPMPPASAPAGG